MLALVSMQLWCEVILGPILPGGSVEQKDAGQGSRAGTASSGTRAQRPAGMQRHREPIRWYSTSRFFCRIWFPTALPTLDVYRGG